MFYPFLKRGMDLVGAAFGLVLLSPVGFVVALLVKIADGGPVFYGQIRVGRHGRLFRIWKFRSMVPNADRLGVAVTEGADKRITRVGRWLRCTKMDELPQLWNVLVGDMSLVGPRPEVPKYVAMYSESQREVLRLRPGITDMASLLFRDEERLLAGAPDVESFYVKHCLPKKIELNLEYQQAASFLGDLGVISRTLGLMFSRIPGARRSGNVCDSKSSSSRGGAQRVAIIGAGEEGRRTLNGVMQNPAYVVIGIFDDDPRSWHQAIEGVEVLGMPECLGNGVWRGRVDAVVLAVGATMSTREADLRKYFLGLGLMEVEFSSAGGGPCARA